MIVLLSHLLILNACLLLRNLKRPNNVVRSCDNSFPHSYTIICIAVTVYTSIVSDPCIYLNKIGYETRYLALHHSRVTPNHVLVFRFCQVKLGHDCIREKNKRSETGWRKNYRSLARLRLGYDQYHPAKRQLERNQQRRKGCCILERPCCLWSRTQWVFPLCRTGLPLEGRAKF